MTGRDTITQLLGQINDQQQEIEKLSALLGLKESAGADQLRIVDKVLSMNAHRHEVTWDSLCITLGIKRPDWAVGEKAA